MESLRRLHDDSATTWGKRQREAVRQAVGSTAATPAVCAQVLPVAPWELSPRSARGPRQETPSVAAAGTAAGRQERAHLQYLWIQLFSTWGCVFPRSQGGCCFTARERLRLYQHGHTDQHYYSSVSVYSVFGTNTRVNTPAKCCEQNPGICTQWRMKRIPVWFTSLDTFQSHRKEEEFSLQTARVCSSDLGRKQQ